MDIDTLRGWSAETAPAEVIPRGGAVVGLHTLNGIGIAPDVILSFNKLPVLIDVPLLYDTIGIIEVIVDILIVIVIITSECHLRQPTVVVILPEIGGVIDDVSPLFHHTDFGFFPLAVVFWPDRGAERPPPAPSGTYSSRFTA